LKSLDKRVQFSLTLALLSLTWLFPNNTSGFHIVISLTFCLLVFPKDPLNLAEGTYRAREKADPCVFQVFLREALLFRHFENNLSRARIARKKRGQDFPQFLIFFAWGLFIFENHP
jgi:hypothetical protein